MTAYADCRFCGKRKTWHGPECMQEWIAWAQAQVPPHANQHTATALVGEVGSGKSGGGICLAKAIQVQPFNVREQVYFPPHERIHVARRLGKGMVVYGDESTGEGGHKRRSMSTPNVNNAMDLDTMRQRNQHSVFTAPEYTSLDSAIQEAVQWVHAFNKAHEVISYEVIHSGKPDNRFHYLKERFRTPDFPHAETEHPEVWAELMAMKNDYLAGKSNSQSAQLLAKENRMVDSAILLWTPKKVATPFPVNLIRP